ncbi:NAD kinase 2, mitochondrial-like isoform X2 [Pollicipes pollicipes]|nr:NAD kinase 2, mitochondrial-like isoform X2 [Pollicipes pollicipes]XP_037080753.1 NAD kinase 2, mitochondrial-like isoform X2 [Pollicipes pollicipes]XP_037080755.1 NAD kinase 2, mitochondrial-like isoform X2 [Pollicipes pollicipes]XP_037080756.1 NAD kinase 2, mitochondrial-like isoform X2 [Pollicipes pollicipes]
MYSSRALRVVRWGRHTCHCLDAAAQLHTRQFAPKKALILTKFSRYEFEKKRHGNIPEAELEKRLKERGSDYNMLLYHHYLHKGCENTVVQALRNQNIDTKVVTRFDYKSDVIEESDIVFTMGGDGTFLLGATRILHPNKPIVGINSDPTRSEGHLLLPKRYSVNIKEAVQRLLAGKFRWLFRKRIRMTLIGQDVYKPPVELHNQQLLNPEYRYLDMDWSNASLPTSYMESSTMVEPRGITYAKQARVLPVLALNEVFIAECLSARVSYYEMSIDGGPQFKQKSSGLCVSTGTGSTSWTYNINKLTPQVVSQLMNALKHETGLELDSKDEALVGRVTDRVNQVLIFGPEENRMCYTIRDPVMSAPRSAAEKRPRGLARRLEVRSRCFDANLVVDGGLSFPFNDGTVAILDIHDDDALRTVVLDD